MAKTRELIEEVDGAISTLIEKMKGAANGEMTHHYAAGVHELVQARSLLRKSAATDEEVLVG